jgi:hypothetical protein
VVVIEHNLEVIKTADWVIDLGPEGGDGGGEIVAWGPPEDIVKAPRSYTGQFLKPVLEKAGKPKKRKVTSEAAELIPGETAMSQTLARMQALIAAGDVQLSRHGFLELAADDILLDDILAGIRSACVIEDYADANRGPTILVLQYDGTSRPIHVVWGIRKDMIGPAIIVTAYRPKPSLWSADFTRRVK